ncbi:hypothetical protein WJX82_004046 [Trebouxia sp. C0006]
MLNPIVSTSPISKLTARIAEATWLADCNTQKASTDVLVGSANEQKSHAPAVKASWHFPGVTDPIQSVQSPMQDVTVLMQDVSVPMQNFSIPMQDVRVPMQDIRVPMQDADADMLASRYNSTPSSTGTPKLMQDASPSPTPYIRRKLIMTLDRVPACSTPRRSGSSQRLRRQHRGPSASADFDMNKENRMQEWLGPAGSAQPPLKAKRKLYCGKSPPGTSGSRAPAKRQCSIHLSMQGPGPLHFYRFASTERLGTGSGLTSMQPAGSVAALNSFPHMHIPIADVKDKNGIASSPALGYTSSEGSARRKSLSPLDTGPVSILPMVENPETGLPSISCQTLAQLLTGQLSTRLTALKIVDCRYVYEHAGGHICGAVNIATPDDGEAFTFGSNATAQGHSTVVVLYCEFSSERAPRMFRYLRNMDRRKHLADYPSLTFPHMYVLRGGYKAFHQQFPAMCSPQHAYVHMHDAAYLNDHKACRKIVKAAWDLKASCCRSLV